MKLFLDKLIDVGDSCKIERELPWSGRAILLVDLDAFFASVEQLDHEEWRGRPVIVGGPPDQRGVVSTASYEARAFGVHSAMPSSVAKRLCPHACWSRGNYKRYHEMSKKVMNILFRETPYVQQVSVDEAFLDVTPNDINKEHPLSIALRIQRNVSDLGITCSIGIGSSKTIAKLASNIEKPRGLTLVPYKEQESFFDSLPIKKLTGVGPAMEKRLVKEGIITIGDLYRAPRAFIDRLGTGGEHLYARLHGYDSPVNARRPEAKSLSHEESFPIDLKTRDECKEALQHIGEILARRLRKNDYKGDVIILKIKFSNYQLKTKQRTLQQKTNYEHDFMDVIMDMFDEMWKPGNTVRLLGIGMGGFLHQEEQMTIFSYIDDNKAEEDSLHKRKQSIADVSDRIKDRFGESAIKKGLFKSRYHH